MNYHRRVSLLFSTRATMVWFPLSMTRYPAGWKCSVQKSNNPFDVCKWSEGETRCLEIASLTPATIASCLGFARSRSLQPGSFMTCCSSSWWSSSFLTSSLVSSSTRLLIWGVRSKRKRKSWRRHVLFVVRISSNRRLDDTLCLLLSMCTVDIKSLHTPV